MVVGSECDKESINTKSANSELRAFVHAISRDELQLIAQMLGVAARFVDLKAIGARVSVALNVGDNVCRALNLTIRQCF